MDDREELTEFERKKDNIFRGVLSNIKINEFKWIIIVLISTIFMACYFEKIEWKWLGITIGGVAILFFLSGFGETEKGMMVREDEAKNILERELWRKKRVGSNEFGLQNGEPRTTGNCKKYFEDGRPIEWYLGWVVRDYKTGYETPHIGTVDCWNGHINTLSSSLTSFTSEDRPDIRTQIPDEWWEFLNRTKGR